MRILGLDMKKFLQVIVIALAFVLASAPAWALGLGQIQVKSRLNEPFLAYIPIISSDPAELQELSAKLADPETFIRVGLPLPDRLVSDLHFPAPLEVIDATLAQIWRMPK